MDGNGRWARTRGLARIKGHEKGADAVRACVEACGEEAQFTFAIGVAG